MNRFVLLFLLGVSQMTFAYESEYEAQGEMTCKVKSTQLIEHIEGVTKKYGSYTDGIKTGDSIKIEYGRLSSLPSFSVLVTGEKDLQGYSSFSLTKYLSKFSSSESNLEFQSPYSRIEFGENKISVRYRGTSFHLTRYYKGDWSGIIIDLTEEDTMIEILTLDCRQNEDDIGLISKYLYDTLK